MKNNYMSVWNDLHKEFRQNTNNILNYDNWLEQFNNIIDGVSTEIVDLGCGVTGNNTMYLIERNKKVVSCDFAEEALKVIKEKIPNSKTLLFDMTNGLPFDDLSKELVIADLSLHYFNDKTTKKIISEINRILIPGGYLMMRVNSTNSDEFNKIIANKTNPIEPHLYFTKNMEKRFFDKEDIENYFKEWSIEYMNEQNMNRWSKNKIIWKCLIKKQ